MGELHHLRKSLGITQEKMALLIGVSRGHLSMYEVGQRELPTKAIITLSEMSRYVIENPNRAAKNVQTEKDTAERRKFLQRQIAETKYKQLKLEKKMADAQKKIDSAHTRLQLSGFAKGRSQTKQPLPAPPLNLIVNEGEKTLDSKLSFELYADGLTLKKLAFDLELYEGELKNLDR